MIRIIDSSVCEKKKRLKSQELKVRTASVLWPAVPVGLHNVLRHSVCSLTLPLPHSVTGYLESLFDYLCHILPTLQARGWEDCSAEQSEYNSIGSFREAEIPIPTERRLVQDFRTPHCGWRKSMLEALCKMVEHRHCEYLIRREEV